MNDRPFHAPIQDPRRMLDIGCGTGTMTNLLAAVFPKAEVIGIDLAPVPESRHGKLGNVTYVQGHIRSLVGKHPDLQLGSFDYVFERLLLFGMTDWEAHIASATTLSRTGGWLEVQESSMQLYSRSGERLLDSWWYREFKSDAVSIGLDVEIGDKIQGYLENTSELKNVTGEDYRFAPTARSGEFPRLADLEGEVEELFSIVVKKLSGQKRSEEFVEKMLQDLSNIWNAGFEEGCYFPLNVAIGQRR